MKTTKIITYSYLIILLLFTNCAPTASSFSVQSGQIPSDFKGYSGTLLVMKSYNAWNKLVEKHLKNNYKGQYLFISMSDLQSKDLDIKTSRFMLAKNDYMISQNLAGMTNSVAAMEDLCIVDLTSGKTYQTKQSTSFVGKLIDNYTQALEKVRSE